MRALFLLPLVYLTYRTKTCAIRNITLILGTKVHTFGYKCVLIKLSLKLTVSLDFSVPGNMITPYEGKMSTV
jgi:hypothetical protein